MPNGQRELFTHTAPLGASVASTCAHKPKCPARIGPTRRRIFGGCLWPYGGQIRFDGAAPGSRLNGCHLRPVNASPPRCPAEHDPLSTDGRRDETQITVADRKGG